MEADLADAVRKEMADAGILMFPDVEGVEWQVGNEKGGKIATVHVRYTITDGTDSISFRVTGCGVDNPGDKAIYKALTGSVKYALMKMFLIPTGDDPEAEKEDHASGGTVGVAPARPVGGTRSVGSSPSPAPGASKNEADPRDSTVSYGKNKGKQLSELNDEDLSWWTKSCTESVAKGDPKWQKLNEKKLAACHAEWDKRQPWRSIWNKCLTMAEKVGMGEAGLIDVVKGATGKSSAAQLVADDLPVIEKAITEINEELNKF